MTGCSSNIASGASCTLTATAEDAAGNTVTGDEGSVTFANSGGGTVTGLGTTNFVNGVATETATGVLVGTIAVTANDGTFTSNEIDFSVTPGAVASIVLTGCSSNIASGASCTLTATAEDAAGNTVTSDRARSPSPTAAAARSRASARPTSSTAWPTRPPPGARGTIAVTATDGTFTSNEVDFSVTPGTVAKIVLSGCSSNIASGSNCTYRDAEDAAGNTVRATGRGHLRQQRHRHGHGPRHDHLHQRRGQGDPHRVRGARSPHGNR